MDGRRGPVAGPSQLRFLQPTNPGNAAALCQLRRAAADDDVDAPRAHRYEPVGSTSANVLLRVRLGGSTRRKLLSKLRAVANSSSRNGRPMSVDRYCSTCGSARGSDDGFCAGCGQSFVTTTAPVHANSTVINMDAAVRDQPTTNGNRVLASNVALPVDVVHS